MSIFDSNKAQIFVLERTIKALLPAAKECLRLSQNMLTQKEYEAAEQTVNRYKPHRLNLRRFPG